MAQPGYQKMMVGVIFLTMIIVYCVLRFYHVDIGKSPLLPTPLRKASRPVTETLDNTEEQLVQQRFDSRREQVKQECQLRHQDYFSKEPQMDPGRFLLDDKHHALFCYVPKNGCSFWKRVFSIVDGKNANLTVFNISGVGIHSSNAFDTISKGGRSLISMYHFLHISKKIMFVRDPYERLFSGYIDKLFSPCVFGYIKRSIIKNFRRPSKENAECPRGISFTEFLQHVSSKGAMGVNSHFDRQYSQCFPCHMDYDFIGHLETFQQDADFLLRNVLRLDPSTVYGPEQTFEESSDISIMKDVAGRTWKACQRSACLSPYYKMLRLWIVFQVRGFLSVKERFPLSKDKAQNTSQQQFFSLVLAAYKRSSSSPGDRAAVKEQRQQVIQEAFRSVPRNVLAKVEHYVSNDCRLFGYICSVALRFGLDSSSTSSSRAPKSVFHMEEALLED